MMKTLFNDFSKGHFLVLATLHCHKFKTSEYGAECEFDFHLTF